MFWFCWGISEDRLTIISRTEDGITNIRLLPIFAFESGGDCWFRSAACVESAIGEKSLTLKHSWEKGSLLLSKRLVVTGEVDNWNTCTGLIGKQESYLDLFDIWI